MSHLVPDNEYLCSSCWNKGVLHTAMEDSG